MNVILLAIKFRYILGFSCQLGLHGKKQIPGMVYQVCRYQSLANVDRSALWKIDFIFLLTSRAQSFWKRGQNQEDFVWNNKIAVSGMLWNLSHTLSDTVEWEGVERKEQTQRNAIFSVLPNDLEERKVTSNITPIIFVRWREGKMKLPHTCTYAQLLYCMVYLTILFFYFLINFLLLILSFLSCCFS